MLYSNVILFKDDVTFFNSITTKNIYYFNDKKKTNFLRCFGISGTSSSSSSEV